MSMTPLEQPVRKKLNHKRARTPASRSVFYFVTVCAPERGGSYFLEHAEELLEAARNYQTARKWFLSLFLIMPDHMHMLVHVSDTSSLGKTIGDWKHFLSRQKGVKFQRGFFETRIRNDEHYREKWNYIIRNPVARGLAKKEGDWKYLIAYNRITGDVCSI